MLFDMDNESEVNTLQTLSTKIQRLNKLIERLEKIIEYYKGKISRQEYRNDTTLERLTWKVHHFSDEKDELERNKRMAERLIEY